MAFLFKKSFLLFHLVAAAIVCLCLHPSVYAQDNSPAQIHGSHDTIPDFAGRPTITSTASGAWTSSSTWDAGRVPGTNDVVRVASGHLVTLDGAGEAGVVGVQDGGELRMGRASRLVLTTGVVYAGGTLSSVVDATGEIVLRDKPLDLATDPMQYGNGLIVLGNLRLSGVDRRPSFVPLGTEPRAGQDRLRLSYQATRWQAGDKLYIAGTRQLPTPRYHWQHNEDGSWTRSDLWYQGENQTGEEVRTLRAVQDNGRTLVLDRPLDYDHKGAYGINKDAVATLWANLAKKHGVLSAGPTPDAPATVSLHDPAAKNTWDKLFAEYTQAVQKMPLTLKRLGHVANLTRSFVIRSENPAGTRGHILVMGRADVDVRHVAFDGLGRTSSQPLDNTTMDTAGNVTHVGTNQIGRYALHFHHVAGPITPQSNGFQFTFYDNSVLNSSKWGVALHDSHYGLIASNVVVGWDGAGIVTEDGSETGNQLLGNFIASGGGSGVDNPFEREGIRDFGHRGDGIWLASASNYTAGNVVCNVRGGSGITLVILSNRFGESRIPRYQGADTSQEGQYRTYQFPNRHNLPFDVSFEDNEAYACEIGVETWAKSPILIKDNVLWHDHLYGFLAREQGAYPQEAPRVENLTVIGDVRVLNRDTEGVGERNALSPGAENNNYGVYGRHYWVINKWANVDIQNYRVGMFMQTNSGEDANGTSIHDVDLSDFFFRNEQNLVTEVDMHYKGGKLGPSRFRVNNSLFAPGVGQSALNAYTPLFSIGNDQSLAQPDQVFLRGFQHMTGCDTQIFYSVQAPDFPMPRASRTVDELRADTTLPAQARAGLDGLDRGTVWTWWQNSWRFRLSTLVPEDGLNQAQAWVRYGKALAGGVAPSTLTRPEFPGAFLCPVTNNPYPTTKRDEHHFYGVVEQITPADVSGCVWDIDYYKEAVTVRVYVENKLVATTKAENFRPDLLLPGSPVTYGTGRYGFWIKTPTLLSQFPGLNDGAVRHWSFRTVFTNSADGREIETEFASQDVALR